MTSAGPASVVETATLDPLAVFGESRTPQPSQITPVNWQQASPLTDHVSLPPLPSPAPSSGGIPDNWDRPGLYAHRSGPQWRRGTAPSRHPLLHHGGQVRSRGARRQRHRQHSPTDELPCSRPLRRRRALPSLTGNRTRLRHRRRARPQLRVSGPRDRPRQQRVWISWSCSGAQALQTATCRRKPCRSWARRFVWSCRA